MTDIQWKKTMVFQKGTEEDDTNFTVEIKGGTYQRRTFEEIIHQAHGKRPVSWRIVRKSVDARKKPQLFYVYTIDAEFENEKKLLSAKKVNGHVLL